MALIPKSNIVNGNIVEAADILNIVEALDGTTGYDLKMSGSVAITGSFTYQIVNPTTGSYGNTLHMNNLGAFVTSSTYYTNNVSTASINVDIYKMCVITALTGSCHIIPTGNTPTLEKELMIRISSTQGVTGSLDWNPIFRASSNLPLPTASILNKTMYCNFIYNRTPNKWDMISYINNF